MSFFRNFQDTIRSKYTPKRTKLHYNAPNFQGELAYAHEPPSIYVKL